MSHTFGSVGHLCGGLHCYAKCYTRLRPAGLLYTNCTFPLHEFASCGCEFSPLGRSRCGKNITLREKAAWDILVVGDGLEALMILGY